MRNLVGEILNELRHYSVRAFRRITLGRQADKLTVSEVFSLYLIDMLGGPTLKLFAEAMGISQPNATYKINSLVDKGYVEKRSSEIDRREMNLYTTRKARKLIKDREISQEELEMSLRARFTEEQLTTAEEVFRAVVELMDQDNEQENTHL